MINWPKQRGWGWYATLIRTPWFCLKLLRFRAHGALSIQRHFHRTEVWLFLNNFEIKKIPPLTWHTFSASNKPVYIIELQYGRKVSESDIHRRRTSK